MDIDTRGHWRVMTADLEGTKLRAVTWNDGKRDKKTNMIIRKNIVASCDTTIPSAPHKKRRWRVDSDGHSATYFVRIPRPQIVLEYFEGAQKIDVHNHHRQGREGVALEMRGTQRWQIRFWQTWFGMNLVDTYLAYCRFAPGRGKTSQFDFLRVLAGDLLNNTIGEAPDAATLRPRQDGSDGPSAIHFLRPNRYAPYFIGRAAAAKAAGTSKPQCILRCRVCKKNCSMYCQNCSQDHTRTSGIMAICGPKSGRRCFEKHQMMFNKTVDMVDAETDLWDLI